MIPERYRPPSLTDPPLVMGVLNVTPDSFSDGGRYLECSNAVAHAREMIAQGADIIDVGGESTRPGSKPVAPAEQIRRTVSVIDAIRSEYDSVTISIDTCSAMVAAEALDAGADMVNDVSALRDDPRMVDVVAEHRAAVVLMHRRGHSADMQKDGGPDYDDVIVEISEFLDERRCFAIERGVDSSRIIFDPGIGFGKRVKHNLLILKHLDRFVELGSPLLVGASRKSFIGKVLAQDDPDRRESGSLACVAMATFAGAAIIRVHDVAPTMDTVRMCHAVWQCDV